MHKYLPVVGARFKAPYVSAYRTFSFYKCLVSPRARLDRMLGQNPWLAFIFCSLASGISSTLYCLLPKHSCNGYWPAGKGHVTLFNTGFHHSRPWTEYQGYDLGLISSLYSKQEASPSLLWKGNTDNSLLPAFTSFYFVALKADTIWGWWYVPVVPVSRRLRSEDNLSCD